MTPKTTILVVDDNPAQAKTIADILCLKGYAVHAVFSGAEALDILARENVHILLTDVIMPDMDGVELYRRAHRTYPQIITFLMTAYAADDVIQQGIAEGIKTVLTKPVDIQLLLNLVTAVEQTYINDD